jgi:hypothetical protein
MLEAGKKTESGSAVFTTTTSRNWGFAKSMVATIKKPLSTAHFPARRALLVHQPTALHTLLTLVEVQTGEHRLPECRALLEPTLLTWLTATFDRYQWQTAFSTLPQPARPSLDYRKTPFITPGLGRVCHLSPGPVFFPVESIGPHVNKVGAARSAVDATGRGPKRGVARVLPE